jgi:hypothetical protein
MHAMQRALDVQKRPSIGVGIYTQLQLERSSVPLPDRLQENQKMAGFY